MKLVQEPTVETRTWALDSRRWRGYRPRPDDIVIATYPKCGTTWMQRIVGMLVLASAEPKPVMDLSLWPDARGRPVEQVLAAMEAQTHRRFLKAHLPYASLPVYDEVRYIHVARDGRDACMSYHNQVQNFNDGMLESLSAAGMADESIARPFPSPMDDPADFFHRWMTEGVQEGVGDGLPAPSWFEFERSWWDARDRDNVLLVHYADLSADLEGEMRRVAEFLGIGIEDGLWPKMVDAAGFESMRRDGDTIMGSMTAKFRRGSAGFFFKGSNDRWKGVFREEDLSLYDAAMARLPPDCARWLAQGRLGQDGG
jgi:aryl sulfotransferase